MSHVVIETTVPVVVTSDDAHEPPVVVNAVQTTTVLVESAPEVIEVNAGPRGLPGPRGEKGETGGVPDAPLDGAAYARQSGAWVEAPVLADIDSLAAALAAKQDTLVSGTNIKTVGGQSLLGAGNVPLGDFLYGTPDPDNGGGSDGDVYIQSDGKLWKKGSGVWTYTGIQFAADSVALTDAAASATLPATAAAPVASRLQTLRNNVKQAFADLGTKLNTDFTGLTTRTIDGTETLALSGGLKATVQAVLNWVLGRSNTWTGTQTFTGGARGDLIAGKLAANSSVFAPQLGGGTLQVLTNTEFGGVHDNHSAAVFYGTMPGGWGTARVQVAISTNAGTYNTAAPALTVAESGITTKGYSTGDVTLKFKRVTVTAGASGTTSATAAHGLTRANVVGFTAMLNGTAYSVTAGGITSAPYIFRCGLSNTNCEIFYDSSAATEVYSKPVQFLIWYT